MAQPGSRGGLGQEAAQGEDQRGAVRAAWRRGRVAEPPRSKVKRISRKESDEEEEDDEDEASEAEEASWA